MRVDPKRLVQRLDPMCLRALEGAVALAVARGHYEVTIEHVLRKLLEEPRTDLEFIFRNYAVETSRLLAALDKAIEGMPTGNTGRPAFSPLLFAWIEEAFLFCTVELGLPRVRSGALLVALLARPGRSALDDHAELEKIPIEDLRRDLAAITERSVESEAGVTRAEGAAAPSSAHEEALARFTTDLTARAASGEIDPVLARDVEIRQLVDVLGRRRKNNPILIGEAGVGKTAVVEGFALRVVAGDVPPSLRGVRLLTLDLGLLQAGAGLKGEFENRLKQVIREVKQSTVPTVLFIDEAHTLIGAGGSAGGSDAANLLKPALARGELRTIAATTFGEYKKYIEKDAALERRFQPIRVDEPSVEQAIIMLRGIKEKLEKHHGVHVLDEAVEAAVRLSERYVSGRQLPDKAVDLLDTACGRVAIAQSTKPAVLDDLERKMAHLEQALVSLERDKQEALVDRKPERRAIQKERKHLEVEHGRLEAQWKKELDAVTKVRELSARLAEAKGSKAALRRALHELGDKRGEQPLVHAYVEPSVIAQIVSDWTGIPVGTMVQSELTQLLDLEDRLRERIVGQDDALAAISRKIRAAKAGLEAPSQPIGAFLLVGPSGVGKTETALALAETLFGGERFIVTVNMSEFMEKHTVSRLIGSPPGYVGYGEGGVLTEAVRHRPYSVVLLDEIEKAHPEVMNIFHQVFDKGMLADGEGRVVDFKNTVIVMTSNLGSEVITRVCGKHAPSERELLELVRPELLKVFKPALLGRMTIVPYHPLSQEVLLTIVRMKLHRIDRRLRERHGVALVVTEAAETALLARCTNPESGARDVDHVLDEAVLPRVSQSLLEKMADERLPTEVELDVENAELVFRFRSGASAPKKKTAKKDRALRDPVK